MKNLLSFFLIFSIFSISTYSKSFQPNYPNYTRNSIDVYYTVVIGSMKSAENADALSQKATQKGFSSEIIPFNKNNILMNRVCVGKFKSMNDANLELKKINQKLKIKNAWILAIPAYSESQKPEINEQQKKNNLVNEQIEKKNEQEIKPEITEQKIDYNQLAEQEKIKAEQEKTQADKLAEEQRIKAEKEKIQAAKIAEEQRIKAEQEKIQADKLAEEQRIKAEQEKIQADKLAEEQRIKAEKEKIQAAKIAEEQRIKAEQEKVQADKLAEEQRIKAEQEKIQAAKIAEEQSIKAEQEKIQAAKIAEEQSIKAEQEKIQENEMKDIDKQQSKQIIQDTSNIKAKVQSEPKGLTTQMQTIDTAFVIKLDSSSTQVLKQKSSLDEMQKKEFIQKFKEFIEYLRNYEYSKANEFINSKLHLFVVYNNESKPSVREFNNFEKFFAVFSTFTSKGTSYDFSLDIDLFLKGNIRFNDLPMYDCSKKEYNKKGQIASLVDDSYFKFSNIIYQSYSELKPENQTELNDKLSTLKNYLSVSVLNSETTFIEGFYFGNIDGKWYLLVIDLRNKCK